MYIKEILPQSGWLALASFATESGESIRGYDQAHHFDPTSGDDRPGDQANVEEPHQWFAGY